MNMNIDDCKSYATEIHLRRGLEKLGFADHRHLVVCNRKGRFTAIFPASNFRDGGYVGLYAQHGFMTLG
jgi:hypothetical protein